MFTLSGRGPNLKDKAKPLGIPVLESNSGIGVSGFGVSGACYTREYPLTMSTVVDICRVYPNRPNPHTALNPKSKA